MQCISNICQGSTAVKVGISSVFELLNRRKQFLVHSLHREFKSVLHFVILAYFDREPICQVQWPRKNMNKTKPSKTHIAFISNIKYKT